MRETRVQSLGREDLLEKEMATHSSILAWENPMDGGAWWATVHGVAKSRTRLSDFTFTFFFTYEHSKVLYKSALRHLSLLFTFLCNKLNYSLSDSQVCFEILITGLWVIY